MATKTARDSCLTRRSALQCTLAWGLGAFAGSAPAAVPHSAQLLVSWYQGLRAWAGLWQDGRILHRTPLPARAHQLLELPPAHHGGPRLALAVARRPGEYLLRFDPATGRTHTLHRMEDDRFLAGHAVFVQTLDTLFTAETDAASGQGLVVARDPATLQRRQEWASGGVGPHALLWEPASADKSRPTLLVANGGILNLPETGRRKLNLGAMDSNLTRLDAQTGQVLGQWRLDDRFLSLRHLARADDGSVGIALQAEHPLEAERRQAPALAVLSAQGLRTAPSPAATAPAWDGYAGDIAATSERFWVSAPHSGLLLAWSPGGAPLPTLPQTAVCALHTQHDEVLALGHHHLRQGPVLHPTPAHTWDNHMGVWNPHAAVPTARG